MCCLFSACEGVVIAARGFREIITENVFGTWCSVRKECDTHWVPLLHDRRAQYIQLVKHVALVAPTTTTTTRGYSVTTYEAAIVWWLTIAAGPALHPANCITGRWTVLQLPLALFFGFSFLHHFAETHYTRAGILVVILYGLTYLRTGAKSVVSAKSDSKWQRNVHCHGSSMYLDGRTRWVKQSSVAKPVRSSCCIINQCNREVVLLAVTTITNFPFTLCIWSWWHNVHYCLSCAKSYP